jgi:hypothetical protein
MPSSTSISVPLANGQTVVPLAQGAKGQLELLLNAATAPSAGTLKVEGLQWSGNYQVIEGATAIALSSLSAGPIVLTEHGHYRALRFTIAGLTGGTGPLVGSAYMTDGAIADQAFQGLRAMNTQTYVETNVKLGAQFYIQYALPTLAGGATHKIAFVTGAQPVLIKSRDLYGFGASIALQIFKQPTGVTGGTPITVQNYNDINAVATTVNVTGGVATTANGTAWGDPQHIYGASQVVSRTGSGLAPGGDRVLKPNSSYLVVVTNADTQSASADYFLTWYEGAPDLPRQ